MLLNIYDFLNICVACTFNAMLVNQDQHTHARAQQRQSKTDISLVYIIYLTFNIPKYELPCSINLSFNYILLHITKKVVILNYEEEFISDGKIMLSSDNFCYT